MSNCGTRNEVVYMCLVPLWLRLKKIKKREFYVVLGRWGSRKYEELEQSLSDFFVSLNPVWLCLLRTYSNSHTMCIPRQTMLIISLSFFCYRRILNTTLFESWEIVGPYPSWWVFNLLLILLQLLHSFWSYLIVKTACRAISKGKVSHLTLSSSLKCLCRILQFVPVLE